MAFIKPKAAKAPAPAPVKKAVTTRGNGPANANPNTVLVVFLVLFVLISIGTGVWGYYGYAGQEDLKKAAISKSQETKAAKLAADTYAFAEREMRLAIGQELDADELNEWDLARQEFLNDNGKFKDEKTRPAVIKLIQEMAKSEVSFDDAAKKYTPSYKAKIAKLSDDLKVARAEADAKIKAWKLSNDNFLKLTGNHDEFHKRALAAIKDGSDKALEASSKRYAEMDKQFEINADLQKKMTNLQVAWEEEREDLKRKLDVANEKLNIAVKAPKAEPVAANPKPDGNEPHALVLDISTGKPLWDAAVGRIVRVLEGKQVIINLGADDGVKSQLTFNVFVAGSGGRADKALKGTIEVIRTVDGKTSLAQITSQSDPMDRPIKADDLLFNPVFGTHVAIAGQVNWFAVAGVRGESPDEQARSLSQFMQILQKQGVVVDAYVDLTNGAIKGTINSRTRYLIRGDDLYMTPVKELPKKEPMEKDKEGEKEKEKEKDADKEKDKDKDKDAEKEKDKEADKDKAKEKDPEKKDGDDAKPMPEGPGEDALRAMNAKRIQLANEAIKVMYRQAIENGCFVISASNFAHVAGYRKMLSTVVADEPLFRPTLPSANVAPVDPTGRPVVPAAPPKKMAEEKAP